MSFNLSNTLSFAQATQSVPSNVVATAASQLNNLAGLLGGGSWQIQEASFNGAKFHIFKGSSSIGEAFSSVANAFSGSSAPAFGAGLHNMSDSSGRRKAVYKFPYVDGQTTVDLGRDGETWTFDCIFFGPNYKSGWQNFYTQISTTKTKKVLCHPVRGNFFAVPKSWQFIYSSDTRRAIAVRVEFIEHTFDISEINPVSKLSALSKALSSVVSAINKGVAALNAINAAIATTIAVLTTPLNILKAVLAAPAAIRRAILADMAKLSSLFSVLLQKSNISYNKNSNLVLPAAVTVNSGGTALISGGSQATSVSVTITPTGSTTIPAASYAPYTTTEAIADANNYNAQVSNLIDTIKSAGLELILYQQILDFQASAVILQQIIELGIASQQPIVIEYTLPRDMSLREVAFLNGLTPDDFPTISQMNPFLDSVNNVSRGTVLQVPVGVAA